MIRITDMTLSCLDLFHPSAAQIRTLHDLLIRIGAETLELSEDAYHKLGELDPGSKYILRIRHLDDILRFPQFNRYIIRRNGPSQVPSVLSELQVNDIRELPILKNNGCLTNARIVGLDDLMNHDYSKFFADLLKHMKGTLQLSPENAFGCATAISVEWLIHGGTDVVTTFMGIAGKAPLEEVMMALRIAKRHKPNHNYAVFPAMRDLIDEITKSKTHSQKPVVGERIFDVASGIHVDGILKKPQMYEPFDPGLVGNSRKIIVGNLSGKRTIESKLAELGCDPDKYDITEILKSVRQKSVDCMSCLSNEVFMSIATEFVRK